MSYGSSYVRAGMAEEEDNVIVIFSIMEKGPDMLSNEDQINITELQNKLDEIYKRKAEGAFIHSRKKWLEEGSKIHLIFSA